MSNLYQPIKQVPKAWGYEVWIVNKDYCGKLLHVNANHFTSWHYHKVKDEVLYVNKGRVTVFFGEDDDRAKSKQVDLKPGQCFHVPVGLRHQIVALDDTDLFEFSTHHEDEDSIRLIKGQ